MEPAADDRRDSGERAEGNALFRAALAEARGYADQRSDTLRRQMRSPQPGDQPPGDQPPGGQPFTAETALRYAPELSGRRRAMLTASNFGVIGGVSPYALPHSLWEVMTDKIPREERAGDSRFTRHGNSHEPYARRAYEVLLQMRAEPCDFVVHPKHSWLGATPDGYVGDNGLIEIKCPYYQIQERVPAQYMAQVRTGPCSCCEVLK